METPTVKHATASPLVSAPSDAHTKRSEDVLAALRTSTAGLAVDDAKQRLVTYGSNRLPEVAGRHPLLRLFAQFHNALIYFLLAAALAASLLGHFVDAAVIAAVVLVNALVGFIQEGKAE